MLEKMLDIKKTSRKAKKKQPASRVKRAKPSLAGDSDKKLIAQIMGILDQDHLLSENEWDRVRKKLQNLIPMKWFGVVGYYQDNWLIPYIYIYGMSEKDQENYYRVYKDMPDLALPFLIKHGLPSRAREILEMYMGVCNEET